MKVFKLLALALAFFWAEGVSVGPVVGQSAEKASGEREKKSLIRKDLLQIQRGEIGLPKRNIFSPQSSSRIPLQTSFEASQKSQLSLEEEQKEAQGKEAQTPPTININLRYIGFVESPQKKIVGLIILEGQAIAVAEGEVVSGGIRIGKITAQEIEIIMPDSTTRKFSLEGE
jgi:hypothetical protein